jgi:hypothetical protein
MHEEFSSHLENLVVIESQILLAQFVLPEHFNGEIKGSIIVEKQSDLSFVASS